MKRLARLLSSFLAVMILVNHPGSPAIRAAAPAGPDSPEPVFATLQIARPGDRSQVVAPVSILARMVGQGAAWLYLELYGRDGRLLSRRLVRMARQADLSTGLDEWLDFEIPGAVETGWLRLAVQDEHQRWMAVDSVPLTLRSSGKASITWTPQASADISILRPIAQSQVSGGVLQVEGLIASQVKLPLRVQLVSADGRIVGQRLAGGTPATQAGQIAFLANVPYSVSAPTPVRLLVFEEGSDLPQVLHLSSLELILIP
jgi:hypothetical protein